MFTSDNRHYVKSQYVKLRKAYPVAMSRLDERLAPLAKSLLLDDELLLGCCITTRVSTFSAAPTVVAVAADRLVIQEVNRKLEAKGTPLPLTPDAINSATFTTVSGGSPTVSAFLVDSASLKVILKTTAGQKLALTMMTGETPFGGGEVQRTGVQALIDWVSAHT